MLIYIFNWWVGFTYMLAGTSEHDTFSWYSHNSVDPAFSTQYLL